MNSRVLASMLLFLLGLPFGCTSRRSVGDVRSAMPIEGKVRVLFTTVKETESLVHYKWSFIGDRNWSEPTCKDATFEVKSASKLNSVSVRGGCFTWEVDVQSQRGTGQTSWTSSGEIRGSNGKTAKLNIADSMCVPLLTRDDLVSVGDTISLGKVGQLPLRITFAR